MSSRMFLRTFSSRKRTESPSFTSSGMMFACVPPLIIPTVTTAGFVGNALGYTLTPFGVMTDVITLSDGGGGGSLSVGSVVHPVAGTAWSASGAGGRASGPPANLPAGTPAPPPVVPGTINAMGGMPIKVGDQLVGAVSVSGAPGGDKDAACANAALAKVADKLR